MARNGITQICIDAFIALGVVSFIYFFITLPSKGKVQRWFIESITENTAENKPWQILVKSALHVYVFPYTAIYGTFIVQLLTLLYYTFGYPVDPWYIKLWKYLNLYTQVVFLL